MSKNGTSPIAKLLLDLGPLAVFFLSFSYGQALLTLPVVSSPLTTLVGEKALHGASGPLFVATAFFLLATTLSLGLSWYFLRHLSHMTLITAVVVVVFGGLTLWLHNETFIKMKPTIVNATFAFILLIGLLRGRSYLKFLMGEVLPLTDTGWTIFTQRWVAYFIFLATFNEVIWRTQTTEFWITTKTFVFPLFTLTFIMLQLSLLSRHAILESELQPETVKND